MSKWAEFPFMSVVKCKFSGDEGGHLYNGTITAVHIEEGYVNFVTDHTPDAQSTFGASTREDHNYYTGWRRDGRDVIIRITMIGIFTIHDVYHG